MLRTLLAAGCLCALSAAAQAECSGTLNNPTTTDYQYSFRWYSDAGVYVEVAHGYVAAHSSVTYTLQQGDGRLWFQVMEFAETDKDKYLVAGRVSEDFIANCAFGWSDNGLYCTDVPTPGNITLSYQFSNCPRPN